MAIYKSKTATKDGRQYFFRIKYKDILGEVHDYTSRKYKTLKEATQEEALYRIKVQNQKICTSNITLEQAFNEFFVYKKKTLKTRSYLKLKDLYKHLMFLNKIKVDDLKLFHYNMLVKQLNDNKLSISYKNQIINLLKSIIKYSYKYYNTNTKLLAYIESFKKSDSKITIDFYTIDEYNLFIEKVEEKNWKTFFEILFYLGLRKGEAQALTWNDIDFVKKEITINKTLTTKIKGENWSISTPKTKNSLRFLPLTEKITKDLICLKENAKQYSDFKNEWFIFGNSIPFKETTIARRYEKYRTRANLRKIRIHDFRHSCASLLINQGASIALVSKYLGHSNITTTLNIYTHMYKNELENITELLNKL